MAGRSWRWSAPPTAWYQARSIVQIHPAASWALGMLSTATPAARSSSIARASAAAIRACRLRYASRRSGRRGHSSIALRITARCGGSTESQAAMSPRRPGERRRSTSAMISSKPGTMSAMTSSSRAMKASSLLAK